MMTLRHALCLGLSGLALALAMPVTAKTAQVAAKPATSVPDLSGFWASNPRPIPNDPALIAKFPPNTVILADTGIAEFPQGEFGGLKVKPDALAKAGTWKPEDEMTLARVCAAQSMIYSIQGPFPFEIYQTSSLIIFKYEYFDQVRIIFMDGRAHPPADAPHSKTGHSIGHWEGNELVIDTTHLSAATITNNGLDHGENVHMIERYKLDADGKGLTATQWFEDRDVLDNAGARFIHWRRQPGNYVYPYDCDPSLAAQYQEIKAPEKSGK